MQSYLIICIRELKSTNIIVVYEVPQSSILGPIRLKIFLCNMFFLAGSVDITSYEDDNTPNTIGKNNIKLKKN